MSQHNVDDPQDDAATVVSINMSQDYVTGEPSTPTNEKDGHLDQDVLDSSAPPEGLDDQTNFLPTKQVIMVFLGLSIALACSMLDQTMYVSFLLSVCHKLHALRHE